MKYVYVIERSYRDSDNYECTRRGEEIYGIEENANAVRDEGNAKIIARMELKFQCDCVGVKEIKKRNDALVAAGLAEPKEFTLPDRHWYRPECQEGWLTTVKVRLEDAEDPQEDQED